MRKTENDLTATNMKSVLWETMNGIKAGNIEPSVGDSIASQAREILRTVKVQLQVSTLSKREVPADVISFSEK